MHTGKHKTTQRNRILVKQECVKSSLPGLLRLGDCTKETERRTPGVPNPQADDADATYTAYCNMLICAAKKSIPRGFNKHYIPGWDNSCNHLLREHQQPPPRKTSTQRQQHYYQAIGQRQKFHLLVPPLVAKASNDFQNR